MEIILHPFSLILAIIFLFFFALLLDRLVTVAHRKGYSEGFVWLFVVVGTAVNLIVAGILLGWQVFLVLLALFAASGSVMVYGDISRYLRARKREQEALSK